MRLKCINENGTILYKCNNTFISKQKYLKLQRMSQMQKGGSFFLTKPGTILDESNIPQGSESVPDSVKADLDIARILMNDDYTKSCNYNDDFEDSRNLKQILESIFNFKDLCKFLFGNGNEARVFNLDSAAETSLMEYANTQFDGEVREKVINLLILKIAKSKDINMKVDKYGNTALHFLVKENDPVLVKTFLDLVQITGNFENRAYDIFNSTNNEGKTALEIATDNDIIKDLILNCQKEYGKKEYGKEEKE